MQRFLPHLPDHLLHFYSFFVVVVIFLECLGKSLGPLPPPTALHALRNPRFGRNRPPASVQAFRESRDSVTCFMACGGGDKLWSSSDPLAPVRGIRRFFYIFLFYWCCSCHAKWLKTVQCGDVQGGGVGIWGRRTRA